MHSRLLRRSNALSALAWFLLFGVTLAFIPGMGGCGKGNLTLEQADPGAVPLDPDFKLVFDIIDRQCVPCHGAGSDSTGGDVPAQQNPGGETGVLGVGPDLSTCVLIVRNRFAIQRDVLDTRRMPPGAWPRLTSEETLTIQRWLVNGAKAPCN